MWGPGNLVEARDHFDRELRFMTLSNIVRWLRVSAKMLEPQP
jgi:hypothetical protein